MRKFFAFLLSLSLLAGTRSFAHAQTAAYAELSAVSAQNFPQISALLDVYDANGEFISGLGPTALTIYEDGQPRPAGTITESALPVQFVTAINPGSALAVRDSNGVARFDQVVNALSAWAATVPADSQDDLSLISLSGSLINHAPVKDWLVSVQSFKPDFRNSTPNLQTLAIALDTANAQTPQPGMKRAVLFITPHMDMPNIDNTIAPLIKKAIDSKIRVFIWFVDAEDQTTSPSANAFKLLALQTSGSFFAFSGRETFPDLNASLAPLRHIYSITYNSGLTSSGDHTLGLYVESTQGRIPALDQNFNVAIQPPNAFFVAPPLQITRQPPADDPYNPDVLTPTQQQLEIIIEFPDGHIRELKRATLFVDGQIAVENTTMPFDKFTWDISAYTETGQHEIKVEVEDSLGLTKTSLSTPITLTVIPAPSGIDVMIVRYRSYVILAGIGLAGAALMTLLLWGRGSRNTSTIERVEIRKRLEDPLTQPVAAITDVKSASKKVKTQPRKAVTPSWTQPRSARTQEAPAYLIRLTNGGEPASVAPIALLDKEMTFGTDPVQAVRVLDDPSIAPLHAKIKHIENGTFMIYDHGSVAGTWVNYEPVTREGRRLQHGDRIHFGQMIYRFDLYQAPAESEPQVIRK
jgi:hypothetical protein